MATGDVRAAISLDLTENTRNEAFIGGSLEYGGVWLDWDDVDSDDALLHGSLFSGLETPLGPLFLALGFGEGGDVAAHFSLGSRF